MSTLEVVRDPAAPYVLCPACGSRIELSVAGMRLHVRHPSDVAEQLMLQLGDLPREELHVLLLDAKCTIIAQERLYQGNVAASVVRVGELFRDAVHRHASGLILVHNHPSGDPTPSPDDLHLTATAAAAGRLLDISLLDHLIIARDRFVSLRGMGVSFEDIGGGRSGPRVNALTLRS